jgi:hypothetical protein
MKTKEKKERKIQFRRWQKNEQGYPEFEVLSQHFVGNKIVRDNTYIVRPYAPNPRERCDCEWSFYGNKAKMCAHQELIKEMIINSMRGEKAV